MNPPGYAKEAETRLLQQTGAYSASSEDQIYQSGHTNGFLAIQKR
jgi:hypothetical protein